MLNNEGLLTTKLLDLRQLLIGMKAMTSNDTSTPAQSSSRKKATSKGISKKAVKFYRPHKKIRITPPQLVGLTRGDKARARKLNNAQFFQRDLEETDLPLPLSPQKSCEVPLQQTAPISINDMSHYSADMIDDKKSSITHNDSADMLAIDMMNALFPPIIVASPNPVSQFDEYDWTGFDFGSDFLLGGDEVACNDILGSDTEGAVS